MSLQVLNYSLGRGHLPGDGSARAIKPGAAGFNSLPGANE